MKRFFILGIFFISSLNIMSATEEVLGEVKVVKFTQKVSIADCQQNYRQLEYSSLCKVPVWTPQDTDLFLANSDSVKIKVSEGGGKYLESHLVANVEGYYMFTFARKDMNGLSRSISISEATPLMQELYTKLNNGEVYWKIYRMQ